MYKERIKTMPRIIILFISLNLLFLPHIRGEKKTIIAIASDGKTLETTVSHIAARCPYFLFVDSKGKLLEAVENPYKNNSSGAGVAVTNFLAEKNVTLVIAGNFGPKMKDMLKSQEIAYVTSEGIVRKTIKKILKKIGKQ